MLDKILEKYNLKYDDLNPEERETINVWLQSVQQGQVTIEKVKDYITSMKLAVENELTKIGHNSKQDIFLKARLRNYMLLDSFLSSPEKAKQQLERSIASFASKIKI